MKGLVKCREIDVVKKGGRGSKESTCIWFHDTIIAIPNEVIKKRAFLAFLRNYIKAVSIFICFLHRNRQNSALSWIKWEFLLFSLYYRSKMAARRALERWLASRSLWSNIRIYTPEVPCCNLFLPLPVSLLLFHSRMSMVPTMMVRKVFGQTFSSYKEAEDRNKNVQIAQLSPFWRWTYLTFSTAKEIDADFLVVWKNKLPRKIAYDGSDSMQEEVFRVRISGGWNLSNFWELIFMCIHDHETFWSNNESQKLNRRTMFECLSPGHG